MFALRAMCAKLHAYTSQHKLTLHARYFHSEESSLSFFMAANERILIYIAMCVHCTFVLVLYICDVAHAIPNPIVRVQRNTSMLVCFRICMYVRMHISIDSIPSNINNNNNNNSYTNKNNNTLKKSHPHRNSCTATIHQMNVKCNGNRSKVLRALSPAMCEYICNVYMHG